MIEQEVIDSLQDEFAKLDQMSYRPERLFKITPTECALLVVDMQESFCSPDGSLTHKDSEVAAGRINELAMLCRNLNIPIIWLLHQFVQDLSNASLLKCLFPPGFRTEPPKGLWSLVCDEPSAQLWSRMNYIPEVDIAISKSKYSPFAPGSSKLESELTRLNIKTLLVAGVATNVCCDATIRDAMMRDYKVIAISDCMVAHSPILHWATLLTLRRGFCDVVSSDQVITELKEVRQ